MNQNKVQRQVCVKVSLLSVPSQAVHIGVVGEVKKIAIFYAFYVWLKNQLQLIGVGQKYQLLSLSTIV